jgi:hypothetical protein
VNTPTHHDDAGGGGELPVVECDADHEPWCGSWRPDTSREAYAAELDWRTE